MKIKIGEMAEITRVSNQTLHYYDRIGILKPETNPDTGYRFYNQNHLFQMDMISSLKNTGMPLSEIKTFIEEPEIEKNVDILEKQMKVLDEKIGMLESIRKQLSGRLENFHYFTRQTEKIGVVDLPEIHLAVIEIPRGASDLVIEQYLRKLLLDVKKLEHQFIQSIIGIKAAEDLSVSMQEESELKALAVPLSRSFPQSRYSKTYPAGLYAYIFHQGEFKDIYKSTVRLIRMIEAEGYEIVGDCLEIPVVDSLFTIHHDKFITEVLIPVVPTAG